MSAEPVLATGRTGYIGKPLLDALIARGRPVQALVRAGP